MARAEILIDVRIRKGEITACGVDPAVTNDHSAVMHRSLIEKYISDEKRRHFGVYNDAVQKMLAELCGAFDCYKRTRFGFGKNVCRLSDRFCRVRDSFSVTLTDSAEVLNLRRAETFKRGTQVGLKNNDKSDHSDLEEVLKYEIHGFHIENHTDK